MRLLGKVLDWVASAAVAYSLAALLFLAFAGNDGLVRLTPVPLVILCAVYLMVRIGIPATIGRGRPVGAIPRPSDAPIATAWCGGKIGMIDFRGPVLHISVSVYQDRFVMRMMSREHTIMARDIESVREDAYSRLRIDHIVPTTTSPVYLQLDQNHPARAAFLTLRA